MLDINIKFTKTILEGYQRYLSLDEYKSIRCKLESGDEEGANKDLRELLEKRGVEF